MDKLSTKNDVHLINDLSHQEKQKQKIVNMFCLISPKRNRNLHDFYLNYCIEEDL